MEISVSELEQVRNEYAELGKQLEQSRIIKLLEETDLLRTIEGGSVVNYAEDAIALIKGELRITPEPVAGTTKENK